MDVVNALAAKAQAVLPGAGSSPCLLTFATQQERQCLMLVAAFCGLEAHLQSQQGQALQAKLPSGEIIRGQNTIAEYLAQQNNGSLLGSTEEEAAKVSTIPTLPLIGYKCCCGLAAREGRLLLSPSLQGGDPEWLICTTSLPGLPHVQGRPCALVPCAGVTLLHVCSADS